MSTIESVSPFKNTTIPGWSPDIVPRVLPTISIFGLGYVGAVNAAFFCHIDHNVIGVDIDTSKVKHINDGTYPIVENGLGELLMAAHDNGNLSATQSADFAIANSDISVVSVGTPSKEDGGCDTRYLGAVSEEIGRALAEKDSYHLVMYRSTVPPTTTREIMIPILEAASGKTCGESFGVCIKPESLRESTAIEDFYEPPKTVIGSTDDRAADTAKSLYENVVTGELIVTELEVAEFVKYVDNTWHDSQSRFR
ncbi:MAG: GDP-mannose 6-dehydrogenase [Candidatus Azotimanducaceae bacterium]|jgi:GDP-mannose 6-dehydrogenase